MEILRDFPDLESEERQRFISTALQECARLEKAVEHLANTVYAAGQRSQTGPSSALDSSAARAYAGRVHILDDINAIEIDFSEFEFSSSDVVNEFYDVIDKMIEDTGRKWYLLVNYRNCSIWPEAWVAFAHRGKKVNANLSMGTVRFMTQDETNPAANADPNVLQSRELALEKIEEMKSAGRQ